MCLRHILAHPSSSWCIVACFESLAQHGLAVPTCSTGTHRSGGIAEVVADWASWLLGPTLLGHSYGHPHQNNLLEVVDIVRSFVRQSPNEAMHPRPHMQLQLLGQPVDIECMSSLFRAARLNPEQCDAKGLRLLKTDQPGFTELNQAWRQCVKRAAQTPGSLCHMILASQPASMAATPPPLPELRIQLPPTPAPLDRGHRRAHQDRHRGPHVSERMHRSPGDRDCPRRHGCLDLHSARRRHGHSRHCRSRDSRSRSRRRSHQTQDHARSSSRTRGTAAKKAAAPAAAELFGAMKGAKDPVAWTTTHCTAIMTAAGVAPESQKDFIDLLSAARNQDPARTSHLVHWMRRLLSSMSGEDPRPINNIPRWFHNTLAEATSAASGLGAKQQSQS